MDFDNKLILPKDIINSITNMIITQNHKFKKSLYTNRKYTR